MEGQGGVRGRDPPPGAEAFPLSSTTSAAMTGRGKVADPGLRVVAPGSGEIMMPPVSVCHHVSTTGQRPPPMCCQYQTQASGLMGSPTEPSRRSFDRSWDSGNSVPHFMNVRMAVGAVYRMVTPYFSATAHSRSLPGVSGVPSYITDVAPLVSGP